MQKQPTPLRMHPGDKFTVADDIELRCVRAIWDGYSWAYECSWWSSGEHICNVFSTSELFPE